MSTKTEDHAIQERLSLERTIMSNQRTFLSFLRTSMYFLVAGLSIRGLLGIEEDNIIHLALYAISGVLLIVGIFVFFSYRNKCRMVKRYLGDFHQGPFTRKGPFSGN
jgi:putative membrane protein